MPTTFPRASTSAPPELPGCTGRLIWKYRGSSAAPASDAISPVVAVRQHLGRKPVQPDVRETHRGHRPAQFHRATRGNGQRCKPPNGFQQSQIIRRIHLHHRRVNQACAREQTHFGRTLDNVIIGNQITIVRDETPCRCGLLKRILGTDFVMLYLNVKVFSFVI